MTFAEFLKKHDKARYAAVSGGAFFVDFDDAHGCHGPIGRAARADLFHLSDYTVSSSSCGGYWIVPKVRVE